MCGVCVWGGAPLLSSLLTPYRDPPPTLSPGDCRRNEARWLDHWVVTCTRAARATSGIFPRSPSNLNSPHPYNTNGPPLTPSSSSEPGTAGRARRGRGGGEARWGGAVTRNWEEDRWPPAVQQVAGDTERGMAGSAAALPARPDLGPSGCSRHGPASLAAPSLPPPTNLSSCPLHYSSSRRAAAGVGRWVQGGADLNHHSKRGS